MVYLFFHYQAYLINKDIAAGSSFSGSGIGQKANNEFCCMG
jgi:hypothetical protein